MSQTKTRSVALDFLRGVAIILVLFSHEPVIPQSQGFVAEIARRIRIFGWVGVDLFFVLSGFLVGGLLFKEYLRTDHVDAFRFLKRRAFKIWPQYYVFVCVAILVAVKQHASTAFVLPNLLSIQNYFFDTPIRPTWSLAVEEHFYLLLTLGFILLVRRKKVSAKSFVVILAVCSVVSMGSRIAMLLAKITPDAISYETQCRVETLALGVCLAGIFHLRKDLFTKLAGQRVLLALLIVAALVSGVIFPEREALFNLTVGFWLYGLAGASAILLFCFPKHGSFLKTVEEKAPYRLIAWIGEFSYGTYLWHKYGAHGAALWSDRFLRGHHLAVIAFIGSAVVFIAVSAFLGYASTIVIEGPMLRLRDKLFPTRAGSLAITPQDEATTEVAPS